MPTNFAARPLTIATRINDPALAAEIQDCLPGLPVRVVAQQADGKCSLLKLFIPMNTMVAIVHVRIRLISELILL